MKIKKALIFGITGQDGPYLANYLIKKKIQSNRNISQKKIYKS